MINGKKVDDKKILEENITKLKRSIEILFVIKDKCYKNELKGDNQIEKVMEDKSTKYDHINIDLANVDSKQQIMKNLSRN